MTRRRAAPHRGARSRLSHSRVTDGAAGWVEKSRVGTCGGDSLRLLAGTFWQAARGGTVAPRSAPSPAALALRPGAAGRSALLGAGPSPRVG